MTNSDALTLAIDALIEQRKGFAISIKTARSMGGIKGIPPLVRKRRWKYEKLTNAIKVLRRLQQEQPK